MRRCKTSALGLSQQPHEAGGSPTGRRREGWEQPRQRRDWPALPDGQGPANKTERRTKQKPVMEPPQVDPPAQIWWIWAGQQCVALPRERDDQLAHRSEVGRCGGHGEGLRRNRGEAAGEELGAHPVERWMVNVGTASGRPPFRPRLEEGKARRPPMAWGRDGALVVVRGRENRLHGEGGQCTRSCGAGMSGGRW